MKNLILALSVVLVASVTHADTTIECNQANMLGEIHYKAHSFAPCFNHCPNSPDTRELTVESRLNNQGPVRRFSTEKTSALHGNLLAVEELNHNYSKSVMKYEALNDDGSFGGAPREGIVYFQRYRMYKAEIKADILPGGVTVLDCAEVVKGPTFESVKLK